MYIYAYLRASTMEQDALRSKNRLKEFAALHGHRIAGWYVENASGASLNRPELTRMLSDMEPGDVILIEQVDRLSRLNDAGWEILRKEISDKQLSVVSLDLPTSHMALTNAVSDDFTRSMLKAVNGMMLDMLAAIARKDYEDRRRRQAEGITKAKIEGKYRGRVADAQKHELIRTLRLVNGKSLRETARLAGVSKMTVIRVCHNREE
ncbi:recombinase family protein [Salmonella enterica]|uniref:LacI family DNA-binding transcriptional regulator n=2 Tax=Salmonella enterica TaxID=28901 RepID=A0A612C704_SALMO|nr:serine recombinase [Salmonella enterica subsp. enterica]EAM6795888.1 LacI family DNA-binding transcriptional regulator [Salmonella enterica]EBG9601786.1 LacI family DNA-binding transcriptional regulator [Salmonella enterica subsp. enterica serovar Arechavaleta]EBV0539612.1 serine recombinase [Salmonella enterica subsp. enterica serovar Glostrup]EBW3178425.1 serine recombinase [Salmonella enterica subsp. enterica serovar Javiana]EBY2761594.1 LacI family DNA-binding transcriptional regulator 